ncbi:MAG: Inositol 2-dehydrogenase/D-chiro-inositol 3-dehydrogenase [bacterium]|nr:Inositol 2-dehydrogenase/D-chiro-inositol 3-dehydrogenase [bacterium]
MEEHPVSEQKSVSRRNFLRVAAAGTAALGVLGRTAKSYAATEGANGRIRMGAIGCGGQGRSLMGIFTENKDAWNCEVTAICDVYDRRIDMGKEKVGGSPEVFKDYRKLLEKKDLDAIIIATPDHWHGKMALDALDAGFHVYLEKPMAHTPYEALAIKKKVEQTGKKLQVGSQHTADGAYYAARKAIADGLIGQVVWTTTGYSRNNRGGEWNWKIDDDAKPGVNLDWDMWLGHKWGLAPKHEWDPDRYFRFRKYYDYSGGIATDLFYHKLAPFMIPFDNELPKRVTASGGIYLFPDREVPDNSFVLVDYPSKHTIAILASMTNDTGVSDRIYGQKGTIDLLSDDKIKITGQKEFEEEFKAANNGQMEVEIQGDPRPNHRKNFLDAVREGADLNLDAARGYAAQVAISLSLYAFRQGKTLSWSEEKGVYASGPDDKGGANAGMRPPAFLKQSGKPSARKGGTKNWWKQK